MRINPMLATSLLHYKICYIRKISSYICYSGRNPGRAGGLAGCGHSKLARVRTGLPLTGVQFISVAEANPNVGGIRL